MLAKALDLFWRKGFSATSMPELAVATGVQRGSLYNAYGDKETLFLLAFDRYADRFLENAKAALTQGDPRSAIAALLDVAIANMTDGTPARGCLTTRTAIEMDRVDTKVTQRLQRLLDQLEEMVQFVLMDKRLQLNISAEAAADIVITFTRGLAVMERVHRDETRLRKTAMSLTDLLFGQKYQ
ncbi:TetR/AcrR family transcriptional regulator [Novosphingobium terrae]|uniref:TetR/AcrR family transcriptional regulator n=1 Tax=Novosphingobium terrae TaxID=2726189 RepID=UPI002AC32EC4|nr:TetR/AcrR family transcriptional regulator [Novosphingobium terrae]